MLVYAILAVTFVVSLIWLILYLSPSSKNIPTIPGLDPVSPEDGNFGDIAKAGSLHQFLLQLHKQYGPIASFWWGPTYVVSIGNGKMFKEHHAVFDRPPLLFQIFEPLLGGKSILYANGENGRMRRNLYDKCLTYDAIKKYFQLFQEVADDVSDMWEKLVNDEHIPVSHYMFGFALKSGLLALYGEVLKKEDEVRHFRAVFDKVWTELELRLTEPSTEAREEALHKGKRELEAISMAIVKERKKTPPTHGEELLLDLILDYTEDEELQFCDALTYIIGGFHTTGNLLTWCCYFLATHPDIQERVFKEIEDILGDNDVDHTNMTELVYVRQVLDETLRCAVVVPWGARYQDIDTELGGHRIPKNTPVIHALGVASMDETVWPLPNKFDPDRFSHENTKKRSHYDFSPFGFAGKRVCPGHRFSYTESTVALVTLLRKFKVTIVEGQVVEPVHGLVTHPREEIWITINKR